METFVFGWSDLGHVLQHGHAGHLFLDGSVGVDLVPKLGSVGCMIDLMARKTRWKNVKRGSLQQTSQIRYAKFKMLEILKPAGFYF